MQLNENERRVVHHVLRELIHTDQGLSALGITKYYTDVAETLFSQLDHEFVGLPSLATQDAAPFQTPAPIVENSLKELAEVGSSAPADTGSVSNAVQHVERRLRSRFYNSKQTGRIDWTSEATRLVEVVRLMTHGTDDLVPISDDGQRVFIDGKGEVYLHTSGDIDNGWVCWNDGPGGWFWQETYEKAMHELSSEIRPATALEKLLMNMLGNSLLHPQDVGPERKPLFALLRLFKAVQGRHPDQQAVHDDYYIVSRVLDNLSLWSEGGTFHLGETGNVSARLTEDLTITTPSKKTPMVVTVNGAEYQRTGRP